MPFGLFFFSPVALSFQLSVVATVMLVIASPLGMYRISGSRPRLPTMMTLLTDAISVPLSVEAEPAPAYLVNYAAASVLPTIWIFRCRSISA
jgi:hypothetical protein